MTAITVAAMIEALSRLPGDAELVVTATGYYCYSELGDIMLPEAYTIEGENEDIKQGTQVFRIGHSHQSY
jgi:hypothetical protein